MLIENLITRSAATVCQNDTVADAAQIMKDRDVGSVVVVEDNKVVGILTDRDIVLRVGTDGHGSLEAPVSSVMTRMPLCLSANVDVEQCLERMEAHGVRRIPIVDDDDELIGVVSLDDILIHLGRVLGTASALVRAEVAGVI
jgi:CBS domain-containing protein